MSEAGRACLMQGEPSSSGIPSANIGVLQFSSPVNASRRSCCRSGVTGASGGEASWPAKFLPWLTGLISAAVLLLVDSMLRLSIDASVFVRIFILLSLAGTRNNGLLSCHGES